MISEKNDVVVFMLCYDDKLLYTRQKIFPKLKKFDEDNDTLTDDEQLDLEIKLILLLRLLTMRLL